MLTFQHLNSKQSTTIDCRQHFAQMTSVIKDGGRTSYADVGLPTENQPRTC